MTFCRDKEKTMTSKLLDTEYSSSVPSSSNKREEHIFLEWDHHDICTDKEKKKT